MVEKLTMAGIARTLTIALAAIAAYAPLAVADSGKSGKGNSGNQHAMVESQPATGVYSTGATLRAQIRNGGRDGWYRFEYGTTTDYGTQTPAFHMDGKNGVTEVAVTVSGLSPSTAYHFHAVAGDDESRSTGPDGTFTTLAVDQGPGTGNGDGPGDGSDRPAAVAAPAMGRTMVAAPTAGTVRVKEKGSSKFRSLAATDSMPVGSIIDAREGAVSLSTQRAGGVVQAATFHGGMFQIRQSRSAKGMTDIYLRGSLGSCSKSTARSSRLASAAAKKRKVRRLWSSDHHGRFRTHGRNSVATVRGTSWYTEERCDGTLTRVFAGKVLVRERGTGRSKLVSRGHSFLARRAH